MEKTTPSFVLLVLVCSSFTAPGAALMQVRTHAGFEHLLADTAAQGKAVIVNFLADWCGPCTNISPHFQRLALEYPTVVSAVVNVDENSETSADQGIRKLPVFKAYKNGVEVGTMAGVDLAALRELFENIA